MGMPQSVKGLVRRGNQPVTAHAARRTSTGLSVARQRSARPLLHWKPIAAAGIVTLTFMVTVAVGMRSTAESDEAVTESPRFAPAAAPPTKPPALVLAVAQVVSDVEPVEPVAAPVVPEPANVPTVEAPCKVPVAFADVRPFQNADLAPVPVQVAEEKPVAVAVVLDKVEKPRDEIKLEIPKHKPKPGCKNFGTFVDFVRSPQLASREAKDDSKLVFLLHVSGDFDDDAFT